MLLNELKRGQDAVVEHIPEGPLRHQLMRFGIAQGSRITCYVKLPFGPVVLRHGGQEIAIGKALARQMLVNPVIAALAA